jgi:hypothetical protein
MTNPLPAVRYYTRRGISLLRLVSVVKNNPLSGPKGPVLISLTVLLSYGLSNQVRCHAESFPVAIRGWCVWNRASWFYVLNTKAKNKGEED